MSFGRFLCSLGIHGGGDTVSGWDDDGWINLGWRCRRCRAVLHLHRSPFDKEPRSALASHPMNSRFPCKRQT